jgi:hypothetical protein
MDPTGDLLQGASQHPFTVLAFHGDELAGATQGGDGIDSFGDQPIQMGTQAIELELTLGAKRCDRRGADAMKKWLYQDNPLSAVRFREI